MKIALYPYSGSYNHGCEALLRSIVSLLPMDAEIHVYSKNIKEDIACGIQELCHLHCRHVDIHEEKELFDYVKMVTDGGGKPYYYGEFFYNYYDMDYDLAICTGGDEYCYPGQAEKLAWLNEQYHKHGVPTFLWGCSIEPDLLYRPEVVEDLKRYNWITAREAITFEALKAAGLENVSLSADPAFSLETHVEKFPLKIRKNEILGINISPLVISRERHPGLVMQNLITLIQSVLKNTKMSIALILHVVWADNDDRAPIKMLYEFFKKTKRVYLVEDCDCMTLKGYISQLSYLICARTHASIAAYSHHIPTLVIGYSVKSRGIATDLFGSDEHFVIPVEAIENETDILRGFEWLVENKTEIKTCYDRVIDAYKSSVKISVDKVLEVLKTGVQQQADVLKLSDKKACCGCSACAGICPQKAINMFKDHEGFLYPEIDQERCIHCGKCVQVCPMQRNQELKSLPVAIGAYNKEEHIRKEASSGGLFYLLAKEILDDGGVVFGAAWNDRFECTHQYAETAEALHKFCGSKYVQSQMEGVYPNVKAFLESGRKVYFSGTPCQIKGLKCYLKKEYPNLWTQDFICHGVPSNESFKQYLKTVGNIDEIEQISFRNKETGWNNYTMEVDFKNGHLQEIFNKNIFFKAFLNDFILRPSCYECRCRGVFREADITLADYWGVQSLEPELFDNLGTSLLLMNSQKGQMLFDRIRDQLIYKKTPMNAALAANPSAWRDPEMGFERFVFFERYKNENFDQLIKSLLKGEVPF